LQENPPAEALLFQQCMPSRRRSDAEPPRRDPITEAIALRAYELFLERGGQHGHDLEDWLRAEQEIVDAINARASSAPQSPSRPDKAR
jgi:DUF2934 family protein